MTRSASRRPAGRFLLALLLAGEAAWVVWGCATILARAHTAAHASDEPLFWRFWTPETAELRALLEGAGGSVPAGTRVLVEVPAESERNAEEVWHWCQYLAPSLEFVHATDLAAHERTDWRLAWRMPGGDPAWEPVGARGPFRLERRSPAP